MLRAENKKNINEAMIFEAILRKRAITEQATVKTMKARRQLARQQVHAGLNLHEGVKPAVKEAPSEPPPPQDPVLAPTRRVVQPFDDIE